jgi:heat shock protein HslJ
MKAMILALLLSGCSLLSGGASASLDGEWLLQAGTNQGQALPIVAGSRITLKIDGAQVGGSACNHYGGSIQVSASSISISALSMTEMACQEPLMSAESAYLAALPRVTTAARNGNSLVLTGPQVELRFAIIPPVANANLVGTTWVLESLITSEAASSTLGERVTLEFSGDGRIAASTGCRSVTGSYESDEGQVQVTLDPFDTIGCAQGVGAQDAHILEVLSNGFRIAIEGDRLTVTAGDNGMGYRAEGQARG